MRYQAALRPEEARILQIDPGKVNRVTRLVACLVEDLLFMSIRLFKFHSSDATARRGCTPAAMGNTQHPGAPCPGRRYIDCLQCSDISDI